MKLGTEIQPRSDGTVIAHVEGVDYTFKPDDSGELVCEVHDNHVPALLTAKNFYPVDPSDYDRAIETITLKNEDADDAEDTDGDVKAPVEVQTPIKPAAKTTKKK